MSETFTTMHHVLMDIADYFRERCRNAAPGSAEEKRFGVYVSAITDADRMLKGQEPSVLTLEEVKKLQSLRDGAVWLETLCGVVYPVLPEMSLQNVTYFVAIPFNTYRSWVRNEYYGKTWRCWSARPTDEQREAVPWQD